jgi:hypothetical protein
MLMIRFDCTMFALGWSGSISLHAGVPGGTGGSLKSTCYNPTKPRVAPANKGVISGIPPSRGEGFVASAFGR